MKNFIKNNSKVIIAFVVGVVLFGGIAVYATSNIAASQVTYNNETVKQTLDDLTSKMTGNCVNGYFICDDDCAGSTGITVADFTPTVFMVSGPSIYWAAIYSARHNQTKILNLSYNGTFAVSYDAFNSFIDIDGKLRFYSFGTTNLGIKYYYVACQ